MTEKNITGSRTKKEIQKRSVHVLKFYEVVNLKAKFEELLCPDNGGLHK